MAKKTYQQAESDRIVERNYFYEILRLTPSFERFCNGPEKQVERHEAARQAEGQDSNLPEELKEYFPTEMQSADEVFLQRLMIHFISTPKGEEMAMRLGLLNIASPVKVIPHKRATINISNQRKELEISPHLEEGRYLHLRIDLTHTKESIRQDIERNLNRYKRHVTATLEGQPHKIKKPRDKELMEKKVLAYGRYKAGQTIMTITRYYFPKLDRRSPSYNASVNAARNNVTSWIKEISEIISFLEG